MAWHEDGTVLSVWRGEPSERIAGSPVGVQIIYRTPARDEAVLWLDQDGHPHLVQANGATYLFGNWTASTVDIAVITPGAVTTVVRGVSVSRDARALNRVRHIPRSAAFLGTTNAELLGFASSGLGLAGCLLSAASGAVPVAIVSCGSTALKWLMEATDTDDPRINSTFDAAKGLMQVIGCAAGSFGKCVETVALYSATLLSEAVVRVAQQQAVIDDAQRLLSVPPPSVNLTAQPMNISLGQPSTLSWSSTNATSCAAPWTSSTAPSGSQVVSPTTTTIYSISCTGPNGSVTTTATVTVIQVSIGFAQVTAGGEHTCGLTNTGMAYCWGGNPFGQIGDGTTPGWRLVPTPVSGGLSFVGITAGWSHTCASSSSGTAYCWGSNGFGELGDGTTQHRLVPTPVTGGLNFIELTAGYGHTCGRTSAGAAYCWGANGNGELGDGTKQGRLIPTPVSGGLSFLELTAGIYHTCGRTNTGAVYCWGNNLSGELGDGTTQERHVPTLVAGGISFVQLTAATYNTCGISSIGAAYCWGNNLRGQLGIGTFGEFNQATPTQVAGGLSFVGLTAGGDLHACGHTSGGVAYCWGYNIAGQLGDGTTQERSVPTSVIGGLNFVQLTAGSAGFFGHTCGRTNSGAAFCWGYNGSGQLGDGTQQSRLVPTLVKSP